MLFPILAIVLALPQLAGYLVTRAWRRAGQAEWLGAAIATYSAIWYVACHRTGAAPPAVSWGLLLAGLLMELVLGILLAGIVFHLRRARAAARPPAP
jgi:hypothetical protein